MIEKYSFTHSQKQILKKIEKDFYMWDKGKLEDFFPREYLKKNYDNKALAKKIFDFYVNLHKSFQNELIDYTNFNPNYKPQKRSLEVISKEKTEWEKDHGTRITLELEAKYVEKRASVLEYLRQTAVVNPHA